jgi:hypothetical protein
MKPYTVILLYPDWREDNQVQTYLDQVNALTIESAIAMAYRGCVAGNGWRLSDYELGDFQVIAVFEGHHNDIKP